jgi:hypothetical protein
MILVPVVDILADPDWNSTGTYCIYLDGVLYFKND